MTHRDTGRPSYLFDVEASFPRIWRSLPSGPLGDAVFPDRDERIRQRQLVAYRASPVSQMQNLAATAARISRVTGGLDVPRLMLVQGDAGTCLLFRICSHSSLCPALFTTLTSFHFRFSPSDEEVPFEETIAGVRTLRRHGFEPTVIVVPDESHCVAVWPNKQKIWTAAASFFLGSAARQ